MTQHPPVANRLSSRQMTPKYKYPAPGRAKKMHGGINALTIFLLSLIPIEKFRRYSHDGEKEKRQAAAPEDKQGVPVGQGGAMPDCSEI